MNEKIKELARRHAAYHDLTPEEMEYLIQNAMTAWETIKSIMTELFESLKEIFGNLLDKDKKHRWTMSWDTRKTSQVMDRKPNFVQIRNHI